MLKDDRYKSVKIVKKTKRKINKIQGSGFLIKSERGYVTDEERIMGFRDVGNVLFLELDREYVGLSAFVHYYLKCSI